MGFLSSMLTRKRATGGEEDLEFEDEPSSAPPNQGNTGGLLGRMRGRRRQAQEPEEAEDPEDEPLEDSPGEEASPVKVKAVSMATLAASSRGRRQAPGAATSDDAEEPDATDPLLPSGLSAGATPEAEQTEEVKGSADAFNLKDIFEEDAPVNANLRDLAGGVEPVKATELATELREFLEELEDLVGS